MSLRKAALLLMLLGGVSSGCGDDATGEDDAGIDAGSSGPACSSFQGSWVASLNLEPIAPCTLGDELNRMRLEITQDQCQVSIYDDDLEATFTGVADDTGIEVQALSIPIDSDPSTGTVHIAAFRFEMGAERLTGSAQFSIEGGDLAGCTGQASYTAELAASCGAYSCTDSSQCCELGPAPKSCYDSGFASVQPYCRPHCSSDADCPTSQCRCTDVSDKLLGTPFAATMCRAVGNCAISADCCPDDVCVETTTPNTGYCLGTCNLDSDCPTDWCCRAIPWTIMGATKSGRYCTDQCSGGGGGNACSECLSACRGLSSCCTGVGCICDSAC